MVQTPETIEQFFEQARYDIEQAISKTILDKKVSSQLNGGKRLRSVISLLVFKACTQGKETVQEYQKAAEGTVSIELAHSSSLIHDDIIDQDKQRRGKDALYVEEGVGTALLLGHKMLALGCDIALKHGPEFAKLFVDTWHDVLSGELLEVQFNKNSLSNFNNSNDPFSLYLTIINRKTAALFSSACIAGLLEAHGPKTLTKNLATYGKEVGIAYQLADDLVDFENGELLDSVILPLFNKINGGKKTLSIIAKTALQKKLKNQEEEIRRFYFEEIMKHIMRAEDVLKESSLDHSIYKDMLVDAPRYIINKMLKSINITIDNSTEKINKKIV